MGIEVTEQVSASKKLGAARAQELIAAVKTISISKGKKLEIFEGGDATDEIVTKMLGTTGNLRAPTIKAGEHLLVGFNEETYKEILVS